MRRDGAIVSSFRSTSWRRCTLPVSKNDIAGKDGVDDRAARFNEDTQIFAVAGDGFVEMVVPPARADTVMHPGRSLLDVLSSPETADIDFEVEPLLIGLRPASFDSD